MNINWFPGHMAKTRRLIQENLKLVDVVIELLDARIPLSSKNPEIEKLIGNKQRIIIFNKADLADPEVNNKWVSYYAKKDQNVLLINALKKQETNKIKNKVLEVVSEKQQNQMKKGRLHFETKTMIVGIPNVGKSTLINNIASRKVAKASDRPGVTRGKQWVRLGKDLSLLDTPGVLWPKFEDEEIGQHLAFTGAIKDDILDLQTLLLHFIKRIRIYYPDMLMARYNIEFSKEQTDLEIYEMIARKRGFILRGNEIDYERCAKIVFDEFRAGIIGKISLETPDQLEG